MDLDGGLTTMETAITKAFGDGEYRFWLPMPRVIAAEREMSRDRPRSILALFYDLGENLATSGGAMVMAGPSAATLHECQAVIRNALCGGGEGMVDGAQVAVGDAMAQELARTYCYPARPAMHDIALAWEILKAAIYGVQIPADAKKKAEATATPSPS